MDLEGIVAKRKDSAYRVSEKPSPHWIKIKNPDYSQAVGRHELFERRYSGPRAGMPSRRLDPMVVASLRARGASGSSRRVLAGRIQL